MSPRQFGRLDNLPAHAVAPAAQSAAKPVAANPAGQR
jgi:hypothetical protein